MYGEQNLASKQFIKVCCVEQISASNSSPLNVMVLLVSFNDLALFEITAHLPNFKSKVSTAKRGSLEK